MLENCKVRNEYGRRGDGPDGLTHAVSSVPPMLLKVLPPKLKTEPPALLRLGLPPVHGRAVGFVQTPKVCVIARLCV